MRETARIEKSTIYNTSNFGSGKSSLTKLPIILCAVAGILLGSLVFKFANGHINISQEFFKDSLFKVFGMDRYNPITIVNANYPYFKIFYDNQYLEYIEQQEKQALAQKEVDNEQLKKIQESRQLPKVQASTDKTNLNSPAITDLKEASSSISFEDDGEELDKMNNPIESTGKINIINQTKYSIDIKKLLQEPLKLAANKKGPQVLVYHTHTTEAYLKNIDELNKTNLASRTSNNKYNVVSVGDALINNLKKYKIDVLHNTTVHDADYNSSYAKSLKKITIYVNKYSSLNMIIDLHRDAISEGRLRVVKKINGKNVAQIMFVVGTDSKQSNPYWKENLKLAIKIQSRLNEICPGIAKPIYISQKRYNQQLKSGSVIIEVGGDGNVIDECVRSTAYLAQAINDVLYKNK